MRRMRSGCCARAAHANAAAEPTTTLTKSRRLIAAPEAKGQGIVQAQSGRLEAGGPMSALGQKQTSDDFKAMSALLPKVDIPRCSKRTSLFNHLVGGRKKRIRNSQAELSRGLEINR